MSDFAWIPDFVITPSEEFKTLESEMETGVKQYRQKWPSGMGVWRLSFKNRTLTETLAIKAFHKAKLGKATAFTWTCSQDSIEYSVRFTKDKFSYDNTKYHLCDFEVELEEDLA